MNLETVTSPTKTELLEEFKLLKESTYKGVKGVWCLQASRPGPTVGITIHTHGNEPSGLVAFRYLREKFHLWDRHRCGRIFFVLNNILATEKYLEANTPLEKLKARFIDTNMNRLPHNTPRLTGDPRYEIRRARELLPIWREFTIAMDIHSTAKQGPPMIIQIRDGKRIEELTRYFPIKTVISGITRHQLRSPAISFYGNPAKRIPVVGIETGSHENNRSFRIAVACVKSFLGATGVIIEEHVVRKPPSHRRKYDVSGSVIFPDWSWRLTKVFRAFEQVRKGRILAVNDKGRKLRMPFTGVTIFGPPRLRPVKLEDEVLFLAKTIRT